MKKLIEKFLDRAVSRLTGEWVLIGGSLINALDISDRTTLDIDIVPVTGIRNRETLLLMEISSSLGMPPETVNMAGEFYLKRISDWKKRLIPFKKSGSCTIYRPSATLFILLKLPRLSETDYDDISGMIEYAVNHNEELEKKLLEKTIKGLLRKKLSGNRTRLLKQIAERLQKI